MTVSPARASGQRDLVVLVHGLWMRGIVFALLARRLRACGFDVVLFSYPSITLTLDQNVRRLERFVATHPAPLTHFVGHSLGGLVALSFLAGAPRASVGRVVLLGSPCNGCSAADQLSLTRSGRLLLGHALRQWRIEDGVAVTSRTQVGAIAGTHRLGIGTLLVRLTAPNDGVVTIDETRISGLTDHITLPVTHSGMIVSGRVAQQVCSFLRSGTFSHA
jgi:pimeloyl-ACP methyl ester carboxylesterase